MGRSLLQRNKTGFKAATALRRTNQRKPRFGLRPRLESLERRDLLASYTTPEDTLLTVTDASLIGAVIVTPPDHGQVSLANTGGFVYSPKENYNGPDHFTYSISPPAGTLPPTTTSEIDITVTPVNDAPIAHSDQFLALQNATLTIDSPGVLKNDTDVDNTSLTAVLVAQAAHGIVALKDGGGFTYTPTADYTGPDTFTYKASDGQASSEAATVYLYVANNTVIARDNTYYALQNTALNIPAPGVLGNDTGINGRPLTASLEPNSGPQHGALQLNPDGSFTYTPATDYVGADSFVYRATDVSPLANPLPPASATAKVTINVRSNAPIVLANNDVYSGQQNTPLQVVAPGVLKNDYVISGDASNTSGGGTPLNIPLNSVLVTGPGHGTLALKADGSFVYTPNQDFSGSDAFTYRAVMAAPPGATTPPAPNPLSKDVGTVALNIKANNAPPEAHDDYYSVAQDTTLKIDPPGVLGNDKGVTGHTLAAQLGDNAAHGTLTLNTDGSFSYTPNAGYTGPDSFTYRAVDTSVQPSDPPTSALAKVTIYVHSTAPIVIAKNDFAQTLENMPLGISAPGVLANDAAYAPDTNSTPNNGSPLNLPLNSVLVADVNHGTLTLNADGSFNYVPTANYVGLDTFKYRAVLAPPAGSTTSPPSNPSSQDVATVTIYVRAPVVVANSDMYDMPLNTTLTINPPGVLGNDYVKGADPSPTLAPNLGIGDFIPGQPATTTPTQPPLTATLVTNTTHGTLTLNGDGSFTYTPKQDYTGFDSFTYQASIAGSTTGGGTTALNDGAGTNPNSGISSTAKVTIYVKPPLLANNDYFKVLQDITLIADPPGVLINDKGPDGHKLAAVLDQTTPNGTLSLTAAGGFAYTPNTGFTGTDTFTYHVTDTTDTTQPPSSTATVTIYVQPLNPPVYAFDDYYKTSAGASLTIAAPGVLGNDTLFPPPLPLNPGGTAGAATNTANDTKPSPIPIPYPNLDGYTLSAALLADVSHGKLTLNADGSFAYTPDANFSGPDTFTYQVTATAKGATSAGGVTTAGTNSTADSNFPCVIGGPCPTPPDNIATVTIYVQPPVPPPGPVAVNDFFIDAENTTLKINAPGVLGNDYFRFACPPNALCTVPPGAPAGIVSPINQPPTFPLTAVLVSGASNGTVTLNPDGSFAYVPKADFAGTDTFTYQAQVGPSPTDGTFLMSNIATVTIKVVPAIAHNDQYQTPQDTALNIAKPGVLANDAGGSALNPLMATQLSGPLHGTLTLNADGSFQYTPNPGYSGPDLFTYRAGDGAAPPPTTNPPGTTAAGTSTGSGDLNGAPNTAIDVGIVRIYVTPVFSGIQAHDDKFPAVENTELDIPAPGVLGNDFGPVNVPVVATLVTDVDHGTLKLNADGSFAYTPDDGFTGEDHFTYSAAPATAASPIKGSTATVTIYVMSASNMPKVIIGGNQTTTDESGPQNVTDWATVVSVGNDGQPATFTVTTDNPALFKAPPAIDATGQLNYTPAPNVSGDATITVVTHDDTGDTTQTFTIHVDKPHPLYNAANPFDVNNDNFVAPGDALAVINYLNSHGNGAADVGAGEADDTYFDVSRDNSIAPVDALMIINALNGGLGGQNGASGEAAAPDSMDAGLLTLVAQDTAEATMGRKRPG